MTEPTAVLVLDYGTPSTERDLVGFYTHIRRGRPPSEAELADLARRYDAIGGLSPLAERTRAQANTIGRTLERHAPGRFTVDVAHKHTAPFIEDGLDAAIDRGATRIVGVVMAPHYSAASVGDYHRRAIAHASSAGIDYVGVPSWFDLDAFVAHQANAVRRALRALPSNTKTLFTAHSLPERVLVDDPYPLQLADGAALIARSAGLGPWTGWGLAWQSAGRTPEPWRGPDVATAIRDLAETGRSDGVLVVPHGFTSAHLEVAYDLDIEAAATAAGLGLAFGRTDVVDDDEHVMAAIAQRIVETADAGGHP